MKRDLNWRKEWVIIILNNIESKASTRCILFGSSPVCCSMKELDSTWYYQESMQFSFLSGANKPKANVISIPKTQMPMSRRYISSLVSLPNLYQNPTISCISVTSTLNPFLMIMCVCGLHTVECGMDNIGSEIHHADLQDVDIHQRAWSSMPFLHCTCLCQWNLEPLSCSDFLVLSKSMKARWNWIGVRVVCGVLVSTQKVKQRQRDDLIQCVRFQSTQLYKEKRFPIQNVNTIVFLCRVCQIVNYRHRYLLSMYLNWFFWSLNAELKIPNNY